MEEYQKAITFLQDIVHLFRGMKICQKGGEVCQKKWNGLRDTYLKERRKDSERKNGSAAGPAKRWKYPAVLSFLDPFVTPIETSSNMGWVVEEDRTADYEDQVSDTAAGPSGIVIRDPRQHVIKLGPCQPEVPLEMAIIKMQFLERAVKFIQLLIMLWIQTRRRLVFRRIWDFHNSYSTGSD
eukprot:superscaffoldBa00000868_g7708